MFGLAVTIPTIVVFWLTYEHASDLAFENETAALRQENKHFALSVFERLRMARATLEKSADEYEPGQSIRPFHMFSQLQLRDQETVAQPLHGAKAGTATLAILQEASKAPQVALLARTKRGNSRQVLVAAIEPAFIWGDPDAAISDGQVCVYAQGTRLTCLGAISSAADSQVMKDEWELFLAPEFGTPSWHFVAQQEARGSFGAYAGLLGPIAVGMLLLALLLSSLEIRRILIPLGALVSRIKKVGGGEVARLDASEDEFAALGQAFGEMESRIEAQLSVLQTLQEIDRLILARVPLIQVIEVVLARISEDAHPSPVVVSIVDARSGEPARHFSLRASGGARVHLGLDPLGDGGTSLKTPSTWQQAPCLGPGFAGSGVATAHYLAIGQAEGPFVRIAIGQSEYASAQVNRRPFAELQNAAELAERVAVAVAAEAHESKLVYQARHDLLTNLPNRLSVLEAVPGFIKRAEQEKRGFATLFIDIDRFKAINDGLGHALGDLVLVEVSRRIGAVLPPDALLARLGGDEFVVVLPGTEDVAGAFQTDLAIRNSLQLPLQADNELLTINFSAGIAIYPQDGTDAESLMHSADLAMYRAKREGGGIAMAFEPEMNKLAVKRVRMEKDLRAALRDRELQLHFQPRVDSRDGAIVGAEALVRWHHPTQGMVMPTEFIALAEACGLIVDLGNFVIEQACQQLARWKSEGLKLPLMAVNVSPHQLYDGDLFDTIDRALSTNGLAWRELEIEITESVLVKDSVHARNLLQRLRDEGATVAIDDFGTGYSSLAYLTSLPTDTIKIDRAFSSNLAIPDTRAVVLSIVALAKALGKGIVAEGVESVADVKLLNSWGCHIIQGYVYSPPLDAEGFARLLSPMNATTAET